MYFIMQLLHKVPKSDFSSKLSYLMTFWLKLDSYTIKSISHWLIVIPFSSNLFCLSILTILKMSLLNTILLSSLLLKKPDLFVNSQWNRGYFLPHAIDFKIFFWQNNFWLSVMKDLLHIFTEKCLRPCPGLSIRLSEMIY